MTTEWSIPPPLPTAFAKLIPTNKAAKKAFSRIASKIKAGSSDGLSDHVSRYVVIDSVQDDMVECPSESESESDGGSRERGVRSKVWTGYYVLDFKNAPKRPGSGMWIWSFVFLSGIQ